MGLARFEKSPCRCARVGTVTTPLDELELATFSKSTKKNVRFFTIGPPSENPPWSRRLSGLGVGRGLKKSRASNWERCKKYQALPWKASVPLFITMFTTVPPLLPNSAEKLLF